MYALFKTYVHCMYVSKNSVEQCLKALMFELMTRLAFTKFAYKQV